MSAESSKTMKSKSSNTKPLNLEEQLDIAWKEYSLDAPRVPNPIPTYTQGLRNMCIMVHLVLPLAKIVIGARFLHSCPTNHLLPTYILVGGLLQLTFLIVLINAPLRKPSVMGALGIVVLIWMVTTSVNIFVEWKPDFFLQGWRYCNKIFFYFAFFVSITEYVIFSVVILYACTRLAYSRPDNVPSQII